MQECSQDEAMGRQRQRELGSARIRLWPRMHGMRPIANLSQSTSVTAPKNQPASKRQGSNGNSRKYAQNQCLHGHGAAHHAFEDAEEAKTV